MVSLFDTAGQGDYEGLRVFTYAQSDVIVVCYSAVDRDSFNNVTEFWIPEIRNYVKKDKPIILVATQNDLKTKDATYVQRNEGHNLAKTINATLFIETSMYDANSVTELFECVVVSALKKRKRKPSIIEKILRI